MLTEWIKEYRKSKSLLAYNRIYSHCELSNCIVTGKPIHYPNTRLKFAKDKTVSFFGTSPLSTKCINGNTYQIKVGYEGMLATFGEEYQTKNLSKIFNTLNKFTKFAFQISDTDFNQAKSIGFGSGVSLDIMIKRHGQVLGECKWNEYREKQAYSNTFDAKQKKHNWTKSEFDAFNKSRAITLENMITRYGKNNGILKYDLYCDKQRKTSTTDYLVATFGKERTKEILDAKAKRIAYFERKYGINALEEYTKYKDALRSNLYYSKISIEFIETTIALNELHSLDLYYANREFGIVYTKCNSYPYFRYDFTIPSLKLIIEFNGDVWHANPNLYKADDCPNPIEPQLTAAQIWERDRIKHLAAESRGFRIFYVWESEYKTNPDRVHIMVTDWIEKCKKDMNSIQ